eukprot:CAMPEP_0116575608 /NCGR_PEP_ID=MMETSP0397-20121206/20050_1 /TAXON_ID=216820 /ORGANISM="Cyclophora tenuis, Strain ECT3854" /LENGTH=253 /DNA_ID=CAMNT_0004104515 /DNA_START=85 /DNA_END=846 /DNA_ORIENTATION=+
MRGAREVISDAAAKAVEAAQEAISSKQIQRLLEEEDAADQTEHEFNKIAFWSVNAIWVVCLVTVVIWFWKFNGAERMTTWTRNTTERTRARRIQARLEAERAGKLSPEEHRRLLHRKFRSAKVHMVVDADDFVHDESGPLTEESVDLEVASRSSQSTSNCFLQLRTKPGDHRVPNCCAVCLGSYDVGDDVVWSTNSQCPHAFHEDCITDWLVKMQGEHLCPCCRRTFIDGIDQKKKKAVHWEPGSMNLSAISL